MDRETVADALIIVGTTLLAMLALIGMVSGMAWVARTFGFEWVLTLIAGLGLLLTVAGVWLPRVGKKVR